MKDINTILSDLKKSPKQMMIVISAFTALLILADSFFFINPQLTGIFATLTKLSKVEADLSSAQADISKIEGMNTAIDNYNKRVSEYERSLPTEDGIPALLESLSDKAKKCNMRIAGIVPIDKRGSMTAGSAYREIPINLKAKSGYHELGNFMAELENSGRLMRVSNIQIRADRATPKKHNVDLIIVTYVLLGGK